MTDNPKSWSATKQQALAQQVTGFWAQDVWAMTQIPVPHNDPNKHDCNRYLRFATHSAQINLELKYAVKQSFLSQNWAPWIGRIANRLSQFTRYFNETYDKPIESLLVHPLKKWEAEMREWLHKNNLNKAGTVSFVRLIYKTLLGFYDERDEWDKECIDLRKVGLPVPRSAPSYLNLTHIHQAWLRDIVRPYLKLQVNISAETLSKKLSALIHFSKFLPPWVKSASLVNREVIVQFNVYLRSCRLTQNSQSQAIGAPLCQKTRARILRDLRHFFDACIMYQLAPFPKRLFFEEDIPKVPRLSDARGIPDTVVAQLLAHQTQLAQPFQTMLRVILEIGCRLSELCELPIDCLTEGEQGSHYVTRYASKQYKSIRVPISQEMADVIKAAQQWAFERYGEKVKYLFPKTADQPYHRASFNQKVNRYIAQHQITDENGQLWHFSAKQCRHTVGTRLINSGVSQPTVQKFLGHSCPRMTAVYAHLHDQTLKEAFFNSNSNRNVIAAIKANKPSHNEQSQSQVVNGAGEVVASSWLKEQFQAQALPNGFCVRPLESGDCQSGQACLQCTHLRTTVDHLPILEEQLHLGERIEEEAAAQGFERLRQTNAKNNQALRKLCTVLKQGGLDA